MLQTEEAGAGTDVRAGWVLDNFPKNVSQMNALQHAGILPDLLFCLKDSDGSQGTRHRHNASRTSFIRLESISIPSVFMYHCTSLFYSF